MTSGVNRDVVAQTASAATTSSDTVVREPSSCMGTGVVGMVVLVGAVVSTPDNVSKRLRGSVGDGRSLPGKAGSSEETRGMTLHARSTISGVEGS